MQTLTPGALLQHGAYRIEKVLGRGGFGITYLATDINLQREVAIKEFFPKDYCERDETTSHVSLGTRNTADFVSRLKKKFLTEARNIAKLDNPGIIRIYSAFEENNTAYYVMEYIEGESLSSMVKSRGPLTERIALDYIGRVGEALEYVHERKINHLDVKPANIMVRKSDDTPILIDFGLSKQYDTEGNQTSTTPTGISHGYAPMEQYNDGGVKEFSPQTDEYSLAATLYYLLSGVVPPQATRLTDEELTFPSSIPMELIAPILKAMSPGRRKRYSTVSEFLSALKQGGRESEETEIGPVSGSLVGESGAGSSKERVTGKSGNGLLYTIGGLAVAVVVVLFFSLGRNPTESVSTVDVELPKTITDMEWVSPLGGAIYTGEIRHDTLENGKVSMVPYGKGIAKIDKGKFSGSVYEGNFVSGEMEGEATYTLSNGDVFTGKFHRNQFEEGKYLDKESGEYFEGTFRDMAPYKGKWYSAKGEVLEEM